MSRLAEALTKAQGEFPPIPKGRTAKVKMKSGGEYSYTYADIGDVLHAVRPVLVENGIALVQLIDADERGPFMVSRLLCGDETLDSPKFHIPIGNSSPQEVGSLLTYWRRYQLCLLVGVVAEDDDDGQAASNVRAPRASRKAAEEPQGPSPQDTFKEALKAFCEERDDVPKADYSKVGQAVMKYTSGRDLTAAKDLSIAEAEHGLTVVNAIRGAQLTLAKYPSGWHIYVLGEEPFDLDAP